MFRHGRLIALVLVLFAAGAAVRVAMQFRSPADEVGGGPSDRPNLVLITIDTLRADHLGTYGYARDTSPFTDRLAAGGTLFEQAGVQWPKTNPSMASMMTSTFCTTNAVRQYGAPIDPKLTTLARIMKDAGYYCASFVANAHLGRFFNFDRGFDEVHELWAKRDYPQPFSLNKVGTFNNNEIGGQVTKWIREHRSRSFFLWVHLLDPHGPYEPPDSLRARFVNDTLFRSQRIEVAAKDVPPYQQREGGYVLGDFVARYDAEAADSDQAVGRIWDQLTASGLAEKSLVVLTADHGESLGEHDYYFDHGEYLYEACLRVPLIFHWPGKIPAGKRITTPVALIDLVPTLLDILGVDGAPYRDGFQGRSFAPQIRGEPLDEQPVFAEGKQGQLSIRRGRWKLIDDPRPDPKTGHVRLQLFNLVDDPLEEVNLAERKSDVARDLLSELRAWKAQLDETIGRYEPQKIHPSTLSPEMQQELEQIMRWMKSMGYAGGNSDGDDGDNGN